MKVVFHEAFYKVYASDPAAAAGRLEPVVDAISPYVTFIPAECAEEKQITAVHTERHIRRVKDSGTFTMAALAAGGAIQTATLGLSAPAFGLLRPPGHHASTDSAWGFCYFNNMAIAIQHLRKTGKIERALVLDIDLHFGDGNVNTLGAVPGVRIVNPESSDREAYLREVANCLEASSVDVIALSAGFDHHIDDWGGLLLTEDYEEIGRLVRKAADRQQAGAFALLEGGYNHDVLGQNVLALIRGLDEAP